MRLDGDTGYAIDILVTGYPGKSVCHGALGWSTIALLRGGGRVALIDVGSFAQRPLLQQKLKQAGVRREDVTDVVLTHSHWDHSVNWPMFPNARVAIGAGELDWALQEPAGGAVPEFYVAELRRSPQLRLLREGDEVLPGLTAHDAPGHTPGCLVFLLAGRERDIVFSGDAAKNRAELLSLTADLTMDPAVSRRSIERIWELWRRRPGGVLVPGHDVPMLLDADGQPRYLDKREAAITSWFGDDLERTTRFELVLE